MVMQLWHPCRLPLLFSVNMLRKEQVLSLEVETLTVVTPSRDTPRGRGVACEFSPKGRRGKLSAHCRFLGCSFFSA